MSQLTREDEENDRLNREDDAAWNRLKVTVVPAAKNKETKGRVGEGGGGPPDGGLRAWLVCLASFWTNGAIFGVINSVGVLYVRLGKIYGNGEDSSFRISLVGSLCIGTTFLLSPVAAVLSDQFGIRQTAFIGSVLVVVGMTLSSFADTLELLYVTYGVMVGVGASLAYTPSLVILGHYFKRRLGLVNGIVTAGSSMFTMVLPLLINVTLDAVQLEGTLRILAAMMSLLLVCSVVFKPLVPSDSDSEMQNDRRKPHLGREPRCKACCNRLINTNIWKNKKYMVWALAFPVSLLGYFVPYVHLVKHVKVSFPGHNAELLITCIGAASGVGRIIFGQLADFNNVSRILLQQLSFFSLGVLTMLLAVANQYWILIVICLGLGIFDGCFISLLGPIAFEIVGHKGASQAIGCLLGICSVPLTLGPPLAGWLYDHTGHSYKVAFLAAGVPPIVGSLLMFVINTVKQPPIEDDACARDHADEMTDLTISVTKETKMDEECETDDCWKMRRESIGTKTCDSNENNCNELEIETKTKLEKNFVERESAF